MAAHLAHGFSGTMDRLVPYAERFAADGIAALVFDCRGFGESGGEPRQVVDLPGQREDLRAAITWVRGREDLDPGRVALWGNSLGGAHVISVAADDPRIVAVVAQIPFNGFPGRVEGRSTGAALRLFGAIVWDSVKGRLHLEPFYIPMVAKPGELAVTATQEADRHIQTLDPGRHRPGARRRCPSRGAAGLSSDALRLLHRPCHSGRGTGRPARVPPKHLQASPATPPLR
jgi:uncharacterized protein